MLTQHSSLLSPDLLIVPSVALSEAAELLVQLHAVHLTQHASLSNLGTFFVFPRHGLSEVGRCM